MEIPQFVPANLSPIKLPVKGFSFYYKHSLQIDVNAYYVSPNKCLLKAGRYLMNDRKKPIKNIIINCYFGEARYDWNITELDGKFKQIVELPWKVEPADIAAKQRIPKKIFQTGKTNRIEGEFVETYKALRRKNPEYEFHFYDDERCRKLLRDHFGEIAVKCFDDILPGAFKADLWRYAALYVYGGVYIDMDLLPIYPLREVIDPNIDTVLSNDNDFCKVNFLIYQAFIACREKDPIMKEVFEKTIHNIMNRKYGVGALDITGPVMFGRQLKKILQIPVGKKLDMGNYTYNDPERNGKLNLTIYRGDGNYIHNANKKANRLFRYKLVNVFNVSLYHSDWLLKKVYAKGPAFHGRSPGPFNP